MHCGGFPLCGTLCQATHLGSPAFPLGSAVLCVVRTFLPEYQGDKAGRTKVQR
ncbi:MAG: hypothetical protein RL168_685 [Bacteroidota bacterium]